MTRASTGAMRPVADGASAGCHVEVHSLLSARLCRAADDVICLWTPPSLAIVGEWYSQFGRTSDDEVLELLRRAAGAELLRRAAADLAGPPTSSA